MAGVQQEIWIGEAIKKFRELDANRGWYNRIPNKSQYVKYDVIHLAELGADPKVLVNNKNYPLNATSIVDADKPVSLDKFETEVSFVTEDELHAISYDKIGSVVDMHKNAIADEKYKRALYNIAPQQHSEETPIVEKTAKITDDILGLKKIFDKNNVPREGRILILSSEALCELIAKQQNFATQYNVNQKDGLCGRLFGFDIYESNELPYYNGSKELVAYGTVPQGSDKVGSLAFHAPSMLRADGSLTFYSSEAKDNPRTKQNEISFTQRAICLPARSKNCVVALV